MKLAQFIVEVRARTRDDLSDQQIARVIADVCAELLNGQPPQTHWTTEIVVRSVERLREKNP